MSKYLVIGYGNPLRGDDGLGWYATERLAHEQLAPDVEILTRHQLDLDLAEPISQADFVIFIDAEVGDQPGKIMCRTARVDPDSPDFFTHHVNVPLLLACAQTLYGNCPEAVTLSIIGQSFEYDFALSSTVDEALPALLAQVRALLAARATERTERVTGEGLVYA